MSLRTLTADVRIAISWDATGCHGCGTETPPPTEAEIEQLAKQDACGRSMPAAWFRQGWARVDFPLGEMGRPSGEPVYLCPKCAVAAINHVRVAP